MANKLALMGYRGSPVPHGDVYKRQGNPISRGDVGADVIERLGSGCVETVVSQPEFVQGGGGKGVGFAQCHIYGIGLLVSGGKVLDAF